MATLVELSGAVYPKERNGKAITPLEGASLVPAFNGKADAERTIYFEHEGNRAARQGRWKLVAKGPAGAWELYDMEADRTETNELAPTNPAKLKELVSAWETWAKRVGAVPWPWKPGYGEPAVAAGKRKFSVEKRFVLKAGDVLKDDKAPDSGHKAIVIRARIETPGDGVIVAQGATAHGFTLYVKDGVPTFAARIGKELHAVVAKDKLPAAAAPVDISAKLAADGTATLSVDGKEAGTGKFPGSLARTPTDPLSVGSDTNAPVGDYLAPFPFKGKLGEIMVEVE